MANEVEVYIRSRSDPSGFVATTKGIEGIRQKIRDLSREKIRVDTDISAANTKLRALRAELKSGAGGRDKLVVQADVAAAERSLTELRDQVQAIGREKARLSIDASQAQAELKQTATAMDHTAARGEAMRGSLKRIGETAAGYLSANVVSRGIGALSGFLRGSTEAASNLGESLNAVQKIFGSSAAGIVAWGKANANSFGLSQRSFQELATPLGAFLKNTGMGMGDVSKSTIDLSKRAADMASVFNTSVSDAMEAIQSGLKGEQDPLEKFGVSLSAAAVQAEAMRLGLVKTTVDQNKLAQAQMRAQLAQRTYTKALKDHGPASDQVKRAQIGISTAQDALVKATGGATVALSKQDRTTAALSLIMNQTKDTAGDFASTSNQLANSQRIAAARSEDLKAQLGQKLLPVTLLITRAQLALVAVVSTKILPAFEAFGGWVSRNKELLLALGVGIVAVLVPAFIAWATSAGAAAASTLAAAAPIIAIGLVIAGLALIIIKLVKHWNGFRDAIIGGAAAVLGWLRRTWWQLLGILIRPFDAAVSFVVRKWDGIVGFFRGVPGRLAAAGAGMWDWIKNSFKSAVNAIIDWWNGLKFKAPTVHIPGTNLNVGGFTIGLPTLPHLASGGIVKARPGGTAVVLGEGGRDEAVVPLGSGMGGPMVLEIRSGGSRMDDLIVEIINKAARTGRLNQRSA